VPIWVPAPANRRAFALLGAMLRVVVGFVLACLAASAAMVGFVITPVELASGDAERLAAVGVLTLLTATDSARFTAPFALFAAALGEWRSIRGWVYYTVAGISVAIAGFLALYANAAAGQPTIVDLYALAAFLTAGLVGGFVYWLCAGRWAGIPTGERPERSHHAPPAALASSPTGKMDNGRRTPETDS
jgi:hypothetical protein